MLLGHSELLGGAILLGLVTLMLKSACRPRELPFATIPLLFAIQQLSEGVIWLTSRYEVPLFNAVMTHVYSFFSHVLWPVYVPAVGRPAHPVRLAAFLCGAGDDAFVLRDAERSQSTENSLSDRHS